MTMVQQDVDSECYEVGEVINRSMPNYESVWSEAVIVRTAGQLAWRKFSEIRARELIATIYR